MAEDDAQLQPDVAAMLDLGKKKSKKKKKDKDKSKDKSSSKSKSSSRGGVDEEAQRAQMELDAKYFVITEEDGNKADSSNADWEYDDMLDRVMQILHDNNPDLVEKKRRNMKPPQLTRLGTKKTLCVNFQEICTIMQRSPEHVFQFFMAELGTEGSIDGNQRLVIRGKYVPKYIESLLRKYIVEYVTCQMCRSPNTELHRDSGSRLYFINCMDCGSSRSVSAIRSGYHATSRADRRAARNAAA